MANKPKNLFFFFSFIIKILISYKLKDSFFKNSIQSVFLAFHNWELLSFHSLSFKSSISRIFVPKNAKKTRPYIQVIKVKTLKLIRSNNHKEKVFVQALTKLFTHTKTVIKVAATLELPSEILKIKEYRDIS